MSFRGRVATLAVATAIAVVVSVGTPTHARSADFSSSGPAKQATQEDPPEFLDDDRGIAQSEELIAPTTDEDPHEATDPEVVGGELAEPVYVVRLRPATPGESWGVHSHSGDILQDPYACIYSRFRTCDYFRFITDYCQTTRLPACERVAGTQTALIRYEYGMNSTNSRKLAQSYALPLKETGTPPPATESYTYTPYANSYSQLGQDSTTSVSLENAVNEHAPLGQNFLVVPRAAVGLQVPVCL